MARQYPQTVRFDLCSSSEEATLLPPREGGQDVRGHPRERVLATHSRPAWRWQTCRSPDAAQNEPPHWHHSSKSGSKFRWTKRFRTGRGMESAHHARTLDCMWPRCRGVGEYLQARLM